MLKRGESISFVFWGESRFFYHISFITYTCCTTYPYVVASLKAVIVYIYIFFLPFFFTLYISFSRWFSLLFEFMSLVLPSLPLPPFPLFHRYAHSLCNPNLSIFCTRTLSGVTHLSSVFFLFLCEYSESYIFLRFFQTHVTLMEEIRGKSLLNLLLVLFFRFEY